VAKKAAEKPAAKRKRGRPKKTTSTGAAEAAAAEALAAASAEPEPEPEPKAPPDRPPSGMEDEPPGSADAPGDAPPRRRRSRVSKKDTKAIEDALRELLQMPAVPAAMLGDEWMAAHFTRQGDALANKIAIVSERNPVLRSWCMKAMEGEGTAVLLIAALLYTAPPLFHFGVIPGGEVIGVPVLKMNRQPATPPAPAPETPPAREAPEPQKYGGTPAHMAGGDSDELPPTWTPGMEQS
jgi:hypothetical protein